jgi:hypothetical protein
MKAYILTPSELARHLYAAEGIELAPLAVARVLDRLDDQALIVDPGIWHLKQQHEGTWRGRCQAYWLFRLFLELLELAFALIGLHKDSPDWELKQIASIAMNWFEMRQGQALQHPL